MNGEKVKQKYTVKSITSDSLKESTTNFKNIITIQNLLSKHCMFLPQNIDRNHPNRLQKFSFDQADWQSKKQGCKNSSCNKLAKRNSSFVEQNIQVQEQFIKKQSSHEGKSQNKKYLNQNPLTPVKIQIFPKKKQAHQFTDFKMQIKKCQSFIKKCSGSKNKRYEKVNNFPNISSSALQLETNNAKKVKEIFQPFSKLKKYKSPTVKCIANKQKKVIADEEIILKDYFKIQENSKKDILQLQFPYYSHIKQILKKGKKCDELLLDIMDQQNFDEVFHDYKKMNETCLQKTSAQCLQLGIFDEKFNVFTSFLSKERNKRVQIASITKIMTCLLVINIAKLFKIDIFKEKCLVSEKASKIPGTSAFLNYADHITVYDLLYGLMLPSGNDASVALGEWGGKIIRKYCALAQQYQEKHKSQKQLNFLTQICAEKKSFQKLFVYHMNKCSNALNLKDTFFANTHGLMNNKAYSTAKDIAKLTCIAMKDPIFSKIAKTQEYEGKVYNKIYGQDRKIIWKNTNKLLDIEGFIGTKTGVTPSAGPCLSSTFRINSDYLIVIVVLNVKSLNFRFKQSKQLLQLALQKLQGSIFKQALQNLKKQISDKQNKKQQNSPKNQ